MAKRIVLALVFVTAATGLHFLTRAKPPAAINALRALPLVQTSSDNIAAPAARTAVAEVGNPSLPRVSPQPFPPQTTPSSAAVSAMQSVPPTPLPVEEVTGPADELENVQFMVRGFRDALGENPVGTNAEITRALMGDNARQAKMPLPAGSRLSADGELSDRWGTPYFFHQLSAQEMEIRSAGPDQEMWTGDDLLTR